MTVGIQTQIALAAAAQAQAKLRVAAHRLATIAFLMEEFDKQTKTLHEDDPMRQVMNTVILSVVKVLQGENDASLLPPARQGIVLPEGMK